MYRFVVLRHIGFGEPHFDLMLEVSTDADLKTWRVYEWPPTEETRFEVLPDHRRRYLMYEGPISDGRGEVRRVEQGVWRRQDEHVVLRSDAAKVVKLSLAAALD